MGVLALLALGARPTPGSAQRSVVVGVVRDTAGTPIPNAEAVLLNGRKRDRTTDRGWFVLDSVESGADILVVRAIGFRPQRLPITLGRSDTLELAVVLPPQVQVLPEVVVKAYGRELHGIAAEAARRMLQNGAPASGLITREDIERWGTNDLGNVYRRAGLIVAADTAYCPRAPTMTVYIDGMLYNALGTMGPRGGIDVRELPVGNIEAIEVYKSVATRPVEYNATDSFGCLILIWTRR